MGMWKEKSKIKIKINRYKSIKFLNKKFFLLAQNDMTLNIIKAEPIRPNSPINSNKSEWACDAYNDEYLVVEFTKLILNKFSKPPRP